MDVSNAEFIYSIQQTTLAATSFGITEEDATMIGGSLQTIFGNRCSPPTTIVPGTAEEQQVICQGQDCAVQVGVSDCGNAAVAGFTPSVPAIAIATGSGGSSGTFSSSGSTSLSSTPVGAVVGGVVGGVAALALAAVALFFILRRRNRSKSASEESKQRQDGIIHEKDSTQVYEAPGDAQVYEKDGSNQIHELEAGPSNHEQSTPDIKQDWHRQ